MQKYGVFEEVALSSIQPQGWLRGYLQKMRNGLTGHPEVIGYPFDWNWWGSSEDVRTVKPDYPYLFWGPYEQTAYWIDGALRCGYLLGDAQLIEKARQPLDFVMAHVGADGYLGPSFLQAGEKQFRWPHVVFFRALMAYASASQDPAIPQAVRHHYLSGEIPFLNDREVCNIEAMLWSYDKTGDSRLLQEALSLYQQFCSIAASKGVVLDTTPEGLLSDKPATIHGVSFNEMAKLGAILYQYTGEETYLKASFNGYRKIDRDHMLIDGVHSSAECLSGKDDLASHETCDIADYMWSIGYLMEASGNGEYADKIERACFNAALGAVKSDFKALQYFSCPNQVIADRYSNHNLFLRGYTWMAYRPNPGTECCPGAVHRMVPNYAARMWMKTQTKGLAAVLYGPCVVEAAVGEQGRTVKIEEITDYPFSEKIDFKFSSPNPIEFGFTFRVPGWCKEAQVYLNGERLRLTLEPGTFVTLLRQYTGGDILSLVLPMSIQVSHWPRNGIGVERGPLVYALKIKEHWQTVPDDVPPGSNWRQVPSGRRSTPEFPNWDVTPASPWNYALALDENNLERDVEIRTHPVGEDPWDPSQVPIELIVPAHRVQGWDLVKTDNLISTHFNPDTATLETGPFAGNFALTPPIPDLFALEKQIDPVQERVTLIPYGCTHLRLSVFPRVPPA